MCSPIDPHREGFTLGQVLAVISVVLLVVLGVGLFLPSVSRMRGAANRMICSNNLKQLALALHNYAETYPIPGRKGGQGFPAGTVSHPDLSPEQRLSWMVPLLPFLEQDNLYRSIDRQVGWEANGAGVRTSIKMLRCPGWEREQPSANTVETSYVGVAGIDPDAPHLSAQDPRAGVFGYDRRTALAQIDDGYANTIMVLETAWQNGPWARGGFATVRGLDPGDQPYTGPGSQFGGTHFGNPWIFGRGPYAGCNVAFADGSVRTIRPDVSPRLLEALVTIAGGEEVSKDW